MTPAYDAVVLAGGRARRMGADKTRLLVGGSTLLDIALAAAKGADRTVVVGPERPTARPVVWACEQPPGAGPAAAVLAGVAAVRAAVVVLLAADLPFIDAATVDRLAAAATADCGGAVLVDDDGQPQWLCSAWAAAALRRADFPAGGSLRSLLAPLSPARLPVPLLSGRPAWFDCDDPADLQRAVDLAGGAGRPRGQSPGTASGSVGVPPCTRDRR